MAYNIKWINKFSNEEGYVSKVMKTKGYFENSYEQKDAKKYRSINEANKDIELLNSLGEGDNNNFVVVEI